MNKAKIFGCLVGISVFAFSIWIKPETTCQDGWKSPSIGRRGACSHHGGVNYNGEYPLIGLVLAIFLGRKTYNFFVAKKENKYIIQHKSQLEVDIETAINSGCKITFLYKKPKDINYQARTIKPIKIVKIHHAYGDAFTLCVNGICDLRKAERNFALKRIKDLTII